MANLFTSESVSMGHPDKMADQISDAILDAILAEDPNGRVACETLLAHGVAMVAGEITANAQVDYQQIVRKTIREIGYDDTAKGFDATSCAVLLTVNRQSPDISQGVTAGEGLHAEQGAGDQGLMFGYACDETEELMPLPIHLAHRLVERLAELRLNGTLPWLRPDGKSQVTVEYDGREVKRIHTVVISTQHDDGIEHDALKKAIIEQVILPILPAHLVDNDIIYHVNPTGRFVIGGPMGDAGLTGRKIIVDTYGGRGRHGGGAFSGKDPSKVDRSAAYAARYIAKNIVAAELARECEIQLAYAIGVAKPVSIHVDTFGTGKVDEEVLARAVGEVFPLTPAEIINTLQLKRPIYRQTACHGHFGRNLDTFTWEKTDRVEALQKAVASHATS